jgi:hypothetical protein
MTETPAEPRAIFPLIVFNRPRLGGPTAGQKEGIIPADESTILPAEEKVVDFRVKVVASDVELPKPPAPASAEESSEGEASEGSDPKGADSSVTDSATPSEGESSKSTTLETPTPASTESQTSPLELPAMTADAEKAALEKFKQQFQAKTTGAVVLPVETTGEVPPAT